MNDLSPRRFVPHLDTVEELLIGTAVRIELPPSLHNLAVARNDAVQRHIERDGSPLKDRVRLFYPQGSMAIGATIRSRKRGDIGYDIDIVAELMLPPGIAPGAVLDLLYTAINGEKGSRYYGKVRRQSRCVTVEYDDGMHLDVTPSVLIDASQPRLSHIFHAKAEEPPHQHRRLVINSFAFVEHVKALTPIDLDFRRRYALEVKRHAAKAPSYVVAEADKVDVPAHSTEDGGKSATIVALQLMKRQRNERYRARMGVRTPPSVMQSKFAADTAQPGHTVREALEAQSRRTLEELLAADREQRLIDVRNPRCWDDRFTDRWPEDGAAQRLYIDDLQVFRRQLEQLASGELSLPRMRDLLVQMFGEGPAQSAVEDLVERQGAAIQDNTRRVGTSRGGISLAAPAVIVPGTARAAGHSFYGTPWPGRSKR
jgi:hypothetical protein